MSESQEIADAIKEFRETYLVTDEAKQHINLWKEKETSEVKEIMEKLKTLSEDSDEFEELVLYGLLPYYETKYAKRVSIAPAFQNIKKFFAGRPGFDYKENDWNELAILIYRLVYDFQDHPENLANSISAFTANRLSKGIQCGSLSPIFYALNHDFPVVNNRTIRMYRAISEKIGAPEELSQKLDDYLSDVNKIRKLINIMVDSYAFQEIVDLAVFDVFCFWYDQNKLKKKDQELPKPVQGKPLQFEGAIWKFSPGEQGSLWKEFKKRDVMSMGSWGCAIGNLSNYTTKADLKSAFPKLSGMAVNELLHFKDDIKNGDLIVAYGRKMILGLGIIGEDGAYQFDDEEDVEWWESDGVEGMQHWRTIHWKEGSIKLMNDPLLSKELSRRPTLYKIENPDSRNRILALCQEAAGVSVEKKTLVSEVALPSIADIASYIESKGFFYPEETVRNFHASLETKPFVILSGITGIGKTKLTELYANAVHRVDRENAYYKIVPVQPNWNDKKALLGYFNPIMEVYYTTSFLDFLLKALNDCRSCNSFVDEECQGESECQKKYFVCLDEMNLAHVEYYFADFLSAMESDRVINLHSTEVKTEDGRKIGPSITIPENLYVVGTVNIDETTKEFSPKVLDRANTIRLDLVDLDKWLEIQEKQGKKILVSAFKVVKEINELLKKHEMHFGYRVCSEILKYVNTLALPLERALDLQIMQKILPKLGGDDNARLRGSLQDLKEYLEKTAYSDSKSKASKMLESLDQQGYTSFFD